MIVLILAHVSVLIKIIACFWVKRCGCNFVYIRRLYWKINFSFLKKFLAVAHFIFNRFYHKSVQSFFFFFLRSLWVASSWFCFPLHLPETSHRIFSFLLLFPWDFQYDHLLFLSIVLLYRVSVSSPLFPGYLLVWTSFLGFLSLPPDPYSSPLLSELNNLPVSCFRLPSRPLRCLPNSSSNTVHVRPHHIYNKSCSLEFDFIRDFPKSGDMFREISSWSLLQNNLHYTFRAVIRLVLYFVNHFGGRMSIGSGPLSRNSRQFSRKKFVVLKDCLLFVSFSKENTGWQK